MNTLRIRKAPEGSDCKYIACDQDGLPIQGYNKISDITARYKNELKNGSIEIIRELDLEPDFQKVGLNKKVIEHMARSLSSSKPEIYGYARVSTAGQASEGNSLEGQERQLKEAGATKIYKDVFTGKKLDRPQLEKLLKIIRPGDTLIVTKLDRFARSISQASELITKLIDQNITVKVLNIGVLDNSSVSTLLRNVLLSFAQFERDMIVERTQEGKAIAKQDPNWREGRKPKYRSQQLDHALSLLETHSYSQVVEMTGISKSTLIRAKKTGRKHILPEIIETIGFSN